MKKEKKNFFKRLTTPESFLILIPLSSKGKKCKMPSWSSVLQSRRKHWWGRLYWFQSLVKHSTIRSIFFLFWEALLLPVRLPPTKVMKSNKRMHWLKVSRKTMIVDKNLIILMSENPEDKREIHFKSFALKSSRKMKCTIIQCSKNASMNSK